MTSRNDIPVASQTGEVMQFVADLRDIATAAPDRRVVTDPAEAAAMFKDETLSRIDAVLKSHPGPPVILLSGGVDSILVAAAAVSLDVRPHAITVVANGGTDKANAVAAATALGLTHDVVELTEQDVIALSQQAMAVLGVSELWEVSYAIPLLATLPVLDRLGTVGPILTGSGADAIVAGGKAIQHPITSPEAIEELDGLIRKESANNFVYERFVPDFYPRVMGKYADRFVHVFQTIRFWEIAETFAPPALFGEHDGQAADKLCIRLACEELMPEAARSLAWAKKSAIQRSAGIMGALAEGARAYAASIPGAQAYTDPMTESYEAVATRLFLALLGSQPANRSVSPPPEAADPVTDFVASYHLEFGDNWATHRENWQQIALDAWLEAASARGLTPEVITFCEGSAHDVAIVEVDEKRYAVTHLGRNPEVLAVRR